MVMAMMVVMIDMHGIDEEFCAYDNETKVTSEQWEQYVIIGILMIKVKGMIPSLCCEL